MGKVPEVWTQAERYVVLKEKDSKTIGQFRTISLFGTRKKAVRIHG